MEIRLFPAAFSVEDDKIEVGPGEFAESMLLTFADGVGNIVRIQMGMQDFANYQAAIEDHKKAAADAAARAQILQARPGVAMAPSIRPKRH